MYKTVKNIPISGLIQECLIRDKILSAMFPYTHCKNSCGDLHHKLPQ